MLYPVLLCTCAGLSTAMGGLFVALSGNVDNRKMSFSQGFAAGVMVTVSLADLMKESFLNYYTYMPALMAAKAVLSLFFCGWIAGGAFNSFTDTGEIKGENENIYTARRMAFITTAVMVVHNLPEGMLTMFTSAENLSFGFEIALAVALHNFPEGMAIASPVLYVTGSRRKAVGQSFLAGMAEPAGGILAYLLLSDFVSRAFLNGLIPVIAGIMCQASVCEMIPAGARLSNIKHTICGIIAGTAIMSIGLMAF